MADQQWYMARRGHQIGPVAEAEVISNIRNLSVDANTYVFGSGMSSWTRLSVSGTSSTAARSRATIRNHDLTTMRHS